VIAAMITDSLVAWTVVDSLMIDGIPMLLLLARRDDCD